MIVEETYDCRDSFADELVRLAHADSRIVAVCNDSVGSSKLGAFAKEFPDRLVNVGIAEQDMVGVGAGLANAGLVPFVCGAATFLTARALEQIKADVAYSLANVKLCGMSPGLSYGALGPTHHSTEDLSWLRAIADLPVVVPADPAQTRAAIRWAAGTDGPVFLRIGRFPVPDVSPPGDDPAFTYGRASRLREGEDATIVATGTMVSRALLAASLLAERGVSARVVNVSTVSPLDREEIAAAARQTRAVVTAEEAVPTGGLGAAVAEVVLATRPVPMRLLGPRTFAPTGDPEFLLEHFELTADGIARSALEVLGLDHS
ncbi:transketolase family protein [Nonomuraea phyllanthi]|uniref:Transketolase family protein n=1 Tax=Nonomuraea phyllanthi TaxID=2219224 RepID=A0A5C4WQX8_9ACTN|nr:transketolase C-terminal domain-containing protein [Nonomuraea phyllanthi]KAB8196009.1 transketolase family protein [Nonomuraea phyllanthi]